jgi:predicted Na+-dependent transporter
MEDSLFATLLLPVAPAVIMTSLGMSLTVDDFRLVVVYPRGVSTGPFRRVALGVFAALQLDALARGSSSSHAVRLPPWSQTTGKNDSSSERSSRRR